MNRRIIVFLIITLLFTFSLNIFAQEVEQQDANDNFSDSIFYSPDYNSIDINDYIIRLPDNDIVLKDFGTQYQDRLRELAEIYGSSQEDLLEMIFAEEEMQDVDPQNALNYQPAPNLNINVGYNQEKTDEIIENITAVEANYNIDEKTAVRAGYEFQNTQEYSFTGSDFDGSNDLLRDENNIDSRFGISYQTTDNIRIFADYIYNDILLQQSGESTVFGLEYNNRNSVIAAEYSIIDELDIQGSRTGLSYQHEDLATFSASYQLLDPDEIEDQLEQEKSWDFGVDFNLNQDSSFTLGLQIREILNSTTQSEDDQQDNEEDNNDNNTDNQTDKETNVEASFQINF